MNALARKSGEGRIPKARATKPRALAATAPKAAEKPKSAQSRTADAHALQELDRGAVPRS